MLWPQWGTGEREVSGWLSKKKKKVICLQPCFLEHGHTKFRWRAGSEERNG